MTVIKDGTGSGKLAKVTEDHRLATESVSTAALAAISRDKEKAFAVTSDVIPVTAESGVLYYKNTSDVPHTVHQVHICGAAAQTWRLIKNPTTGTL